MHEQLQPKGFVVPTADYECLHTEFDNESLQRAFLGRWPDRIAFGRELLAETRAAQHLATLPRWMREYVTVDAEHYVRDLEGVGAFVVRDVSTGIAVFDGLLLGGP